jgi:hypothetical protein
LRQRRRALGTLVAGLVALAAAPIALSVNTVPAHASAVAQTCPYPSDCPTTVQGNPNGGNGNGNNGNGNNGNGNNGNGNGNTNNSGNANADNPGNASGNNLGTDNGGNAGANRAGLAASVLGTSFSRGGAPVVSASNGDSLLAFTGMGLVRLVLLALVLIAAGWFLTRRAEARRI